MNTESHIVIKDITKKYGDRTVFSGFGIQIEKSASTVLMGRSGRGKTTLLRMLMGLDMPDSGIICGHEAMRLSAVFQEDRLCELLSVETNIKMVLSSGRGGNPKSRHERIAENLRLAGLENEIRTPVKNLSGGMKRRVAIVRAVMAESDLILMDEPFRGLDSETRLMCMKYVRENTKGKTLVISTHSDEEARYMGDNIIKI